MSGVVVRLTGDKYKLFPMGAQGAREKPRPATTNRNWPGQIESFADPRLGALLRLTTSDPKIPSVPQTEVESDPFAEALPDALAALHPLAAPEIVQPPSLRCWKMICGEACHVQVTSRLSPAPASEHGSSSSALLWRFARLPLRGSAPRDSTPCAVKRVKPICTEMQLRASPKRRKEWRWMLCASPAARGGDDRLWNRTLASAIHLHSPSRFCPASPPSGVPNGGASLDAYVLPRVHACVKTLPVRILPCGRSYGRSRRPYVPERRLDVPRPHTPYTRAGRLRRGRLVPFEIGHWFGSAPRFVGVRRIQPPETAYESRC